MNQEAEKIEEISERLVAAKESRDHYTRLVVQIERELAEALEN